MLYKAVALIISSNLAFFSCASISIPPPPKQPAINDDKLVEAYIEDREKDKLPKSSFGRVVLLKGDASPGDGVLLDEKEVARLALIKAERDRLHSDLITERKLKLKVDYLNAKALWEAEVKFLKSQPTWWERHDGKIALFTGLVLGSMVCIGVAYSINHISTK